MITITLLQHPEYKKEISLAASKLSGLMTSMLGEETEGELPFDLDDLTPDIMDKVLAFLTHHETNPVMAYALPITTNVVKELVGEWDANFVDLENDQETLVSLIKAGNYLDCDSLLDLGLLKIAAMIKDKDQDTVKELFHIDKDITPEEEAQVREANPWVFEIGEKKAVVN